MINLFWKPLFEYSDVVNANNNPWWYEKNVLYAYLTEDLCTVLYFGIAWNKTVRECWEQDEKRGLFNKFKEEHGHRNVEIFAGHVLQEVGQRLSKQLLTYVCWLLIDKMKPMGNILMKKQAIRKTKMVIKYYGILGKPKIINT